MKDSKTLEAEFNQIRDRYVAEANRYGHENAFLHDAFDECWALTLTKLEEAKIEAYEEGKQRGVEFAVNVLVREVQPVPEDLMKHYSKFLSESPKEV